MPLTVVSRGRKIRKSAPLSLVKRTRRLARKVNYLMPEIKFTDNFNAGTISDTASVSYISNIAQGDDDSQRDGNQIRVNYIWGRWSTVVADTTNVVRILIIKDKNSNGVVPLETEIFETVNNPYSPINSRYLHRFKVKYDKLACASAAGPQVATGKFFIRCNKAITEYIGTAATTAASGINSYWLVRISDSAAVGNPYIGVYTRLAYTG